jgi:glycosyltransferase XagB
VSVIREQTQVKARPFARLRVLDGVRGLALLSVLANHGGVFPAGFIGVDIFFVLSGFLITVLLCQEWDRYGRIDWWGFYLRRFRRLAPALAVLVAAVLVVQRCGLAVAVMPLPLQVLTTFGSVNNWVVAFAPQALGLLTPTWTLAQETQFYLLGPLVVVLLLRRRTRPAMQALVLVTVVVALLVTGSAAFGTVGANYGYYDPFARAAEPLLGCLAAVAWRYRLAITRPLVHWLLGVVPPLLIVGFAVATGYPLAWRLPAATLCAGVWLVHLVSGAGGAVRGLLEWRPLRYTGQISYGLYLYQEPMDHLAWWLAPESSPSLHTLVMATLSFTVAVPSWYLIERGFLRGGHHAPSAQRTASLPPGDEPLAVATPPRTVPRTDIAELPDAVSARAVLGRGQKLTLMVIVGCLATWLVTRWLTGWGPAGAQVWTASMVLLTLTSLVGTGYLAVLAVAGAKARVLHTSAYPVPDIAERELPRYSILVPLYREEVVLPALITQLAALDYPADRLQILLLIEQDDTATRAALARLTLDERFEVLIFEPSLPRTKPKACNIGLARVDGEFCTIYDAEDRPEPDQLRKAVAAFRALGDDVVCIQAELLHWNPDTNWLTASFAAEYAQRYGLTLRGLDRFRLPIPLGGNSNHFRTAALCQLGGWDPHNLTEDADLGIRIARAGCQVRMMASVTEEEANSQLGNWLRQRSRWIKGHLQTWLVHTRCPRQLIRELGVCGFCSVHLTLGLPALATLLNPLLWLIGLIWIFAEPRPQQVSLPQLFCFAGLALTYLSTVIQLTAAVRTQPPLRHAANAIATVPLYWLLMSIAGYKALIQLLRPSRRHYWELTRHGLVNR